MLIRKYEIETIALYVNIIYFLFRYKREREQASKLASSGNVLSAKSRSGNRKRRSSSQGHCQSSGEDSITDQQENMSDLFEDSFSQDEEMQIVEMDIASSPSSTLCLTPVTRNIRHCAQATPSPNQRLFGTDKRNYVNTMSRNNYAVSTPSSTISTVVTPMGLSSVHNQRSKVMTPITPKSSSHTSWMESPLGSRPPKPKRIWLEREQENRDDQYFSTQIVNTSQENMTCLKYEISERSAFCYDNQPRPSVLVMASPVFEVDPRNDSYRNNIGGKINQNQHPEGEVDQSYVTFYGVNGGASKGFHEEQSGQYAQIQHFKTNADNHSYAINKYDNEIQGNPPVNSRFNVNNNSLNNISSIHLTAQI